MSEGLIKRLEAATGRDRELDHAIYHELGLHPKSGPFPRIPNYTSSIDAALTLVPEGFTRAVDATAPELGIDVTLFPPDDTAEVRGTHANEAVATCIAALKARTP